MADQGGLGESGKDGMTRLSLAFWWLEGSGSEILSLLKSTGSQSELWIKFPTTWWCQVPTLTAKSQSHGVIPCSTGDPAASNYRCIPNISASVNLLTRSHTQRIDHHILRVSKDILCVYKCIYIIYIYINTCIIVYTYIYTNWYTYLSIGHFVGVYGMKHCESSSFGWWFQFLFHVRPECLWDGKHTNEQSD